MTINDLIIDFQETSQLVAEKFYEKYGTKELLLSANSNKSIPRQGSFDIIKNYSFHGCGLYAKLKDKEIDFDFGDNNRTDGFDAWRLKRFADSMPKLYQMFNSEELIQIELDKLVQMRKIHKPGSFPGSSNYYWTNETNT